MCAFFTDARQPATPAVAPVFVPTVFTMQQALLSILLLLLLPIYGSATDADLIRVLGPQAVNLWRLDAATRSTERASSARTVQGSVQEPFFAAKTDSKPKGTFPEHWFTQPLDHFSNETHTFQQRYWINTRHYKPGSKGPVIVLDGGETSGEDRLPFLDTGIVEILARATDGVGVILEHRYYGESIAVHNLSTDSLRWLNNEQAAADSANFIANVKFPGVEEDLTAPGTPWIYYGGSYAGARAAHMKILYPDLVYGAIASSGVTHATLENWEYMEIIRRAADPVCSLNLEHAIEVIDALLAVPVVKHQVKALFGLAELEHDEDFASLLESPLGSWQAKNWDPTVGSTRFDEFCNVLAKGVSTLEKGMHFDDASNTVTLPTGLSIPLVVYNYAQYIKQHYVSRCPQDASIEDCFGTYVDANFQDTSLDETWRLWVFQVCTQWGYFSTAPPNGQRRIISRLLTLEYESKICEQAFLPGEHFIVPVLPNITAVNALGDFQIAADRLAIIDGEVDPWRPDTPHSEYAADRRDTVLRPFKLIPNGVHHYDEFGLRDISQEPPEIEKIHLEMIDFVTAWLKEWKAPESS